MHNFQTNVVEIINAMIINYKDNNVSLNFAYLVNDIKGVANCVSFINKQSLTFINMYRFLKETSLK